MGKKKAAQGKQAKSANSSGYKPMPMVSVCTPTFNRRPFIETMLQCFRNQTYPKSRIEWIIVDDGTDKISDLIDAAKIPQIKYYSLDKKLSLGAKRNYMHEKATGSILVYMDDDDYYPPERIAHAVERLMANPSALAAGSSEMYIYFKHIQKMYQAGPYGPNHATAGTFAFRRSLLDQTKYEDHAALAEEKSFLKDYTVPFVQLDPLKTILVFSHEQNTFDKRKLLENPHPQYMKESTKKVTDFIARSNETAIYDFFMNRIDGLLEKYEPGSSSFKPDVIVQMKEIEKKREEMMKQMQMQQPPQIMVNEPGKPPRALTSQEIIQLVQGQQEQLNKQAEYIQLVQGQQEQLNKQAEYIQTLTTHIKKLEAVVNTSQQQLIAIATKHGYEIKRTEPQEALGLAPSHGPGPSSTNIDNTVLF